MTHVYKTSVYKTILKAKYTYFYTENFEKCLVTQNNAIKIPEKLIFFYAYSRYRE